jgi:hypothetical protein
MSMVVDVAQAVTEELNGGSFSQGFTAERHYQPVFELPDMKTLHVTVVPRAITIATLDRGRCQHDVQIDVAVQKKFGSDAPVEIDPLMDLVQEIADFFRQRRLAGCPTAVWVKTENAPLYAQEHMNEMRQFTSVLTFSFRIFR